MNQKRIKHAAVAACIGTAGKYRFSKNGARRWFVPVSVVAKARQGDVRWRNAMSCACAIFRLGNRSLGERGVSPKTNESNSLS